MFDDSTCAPRKHRGGRRLFNTGSALAMTIALSSTPAIGADEKLRPRGMIGAPRAASAPAPLPGARSVELDAMVAAARADAAQRAGVDDSALQLIAAQRVTWPDGGLGCPQPGVRYTMALVRGYRIQMGLDGRVFDYHASERGSLLLCPNGAASSPMPDRTI
jgi:hypothetical protein